MTNQIKNINMLETTQCELYFISGLKLTALVITKIVFFMLVDS